jgi:hypothetical protein
VSVESLIGDEERRFEPSGGETAEAIYMKKWAAALVEQVLRRLQQFYAEEGRPVWYDLFAATHGVTPPTERVSQQQLGERFGLTRDQVRYALEITEKRFAHLLREEVRDQVGTEAEVGEEVRDLLTLLRT